MQTTGDVRERLLDEVRGGLSIRKAAARVGVSVGSATRWARAANVKGKTPLRIDPRSRKQIADAIAGGRSCEDVAEAFGIDPAIAAKIANGAKTSPKSPKTPKSKPEVVADARRRGLHLRQVYEARREKVAEAVAKGLSVHGAAAEFGIRAKTVAKMVHEAEFERRREEFKLRIMAAVDAGLSIRQAAAAVGVSVGSATRWARATGSRSRPAPVRHGPEKREAVLRALADGLSMSEAASLAGVTRGCAYQWWRKATKTPG